jgi:hypothetical protein
MLRLTPELENTVIIELFQALGLSRATFASINQLLLKHFTPEEFLIWDDLWYWGFFTQFSQRNEPDQVGKVYSSSRTMAWNSDKFWCQACSPKNHEREVQALAEEFIRLCA